MIRLRTVVRAVAALSVLLAVIAVRAVTSARTELARGDRLLDAQDTEGAVLAFARAARWYVPGNPYCSRALDRLAAIAAEREAAGDVESALAAHRAIRGAILATRSFYVPNGARLDRANAQLEALINAQHTPLDDHGEARVVRLGRPDRPVDAWAIFGLLGWLAWTLGAFVFARFAIDEEDRVRAREARVWGTVVLVGFGCFVIGLTLA